jgi:hypothetical protein
MSENDNKQEPKADEIVKILCGLCMINETCPIGHNVICVKAKQAREELAIWFGKRYDDLIESKKTPYQALQYIISDFRRTK